jgi:hypothetical protein
MTNIKEYYLVSSETEQEFINEIQEFLYDYEWQPLGSPFVDSAGYYCQAMVIYEEEQPPTNNSERTT